MLQIADTPKKTHEEILQADGAVHLRRLDQNLANLRLLLKAMSLQDRERYEDAFLFSIDGMSEPIEAIDNLIAAAAERSAG